MNINRLKSLERLHNAAGTVASRFEGAESAINALQAQSAANAVVIQEIKEVRCEANERLFFINNITFFL